jgi:hypothetical protein
MILSALGQAFTDLFLLGVSLGSQVKGLIYSTKLKDFSKSKEIFCSQNQRKHESIILDNQISKRRGEMQPRLLKIRIYPLER